MADANRSVNSKVIKNIYSDSAFGSRVIAITAFVNGAGFKSRVDLTSSFNFFCGIQLW